jgi:hypothetical protein
VQEEDRDRERVERRRRRGRNERRREIGVQSMGTTVYTIMVWNSRQGPDMIGRVQGQFSYK